MAVNNPTPRRRCFCSRKPRPFRIGLHEQNRNHMFLFVFFLVIEAAAAALSQPAEAVSQLWPQQFNAATSLHVAHAAASLADDGIIRIANALSLQSSVKLLEHVNSALPALSPESRPNWWTPRGGPERGARQRDVNWVFSDSVWSVMRAAAGAVRGPTPTRGRGRDSAAHF